MAISKANWKGIFAFAVVLLFVLMVFSPITAQKNIKVPIGTSSSSGKSPVASQYPSQDPINSIQSQLNVADNGSAFSSLGENLSSFETPSIYQNKEVTIATQNLQITTIGYTNGKYVLAGENTSQTPLFILYNSSTSTFDYPSQEVPSSLRTINTMIAMGQNLYLLGTPTGNTLPFAEYNISNGTFRDLSNSFSSSPSGANIYQATLIGTTIYMGGYYQQAGQNALLLSYNTSTGTMLNLTHDLPAGTTMINAVVSYKNSLLLAGSGQSSVFALIYNVSTGSETNIPLPADVYGITTGTVLGGDFYLGGGSVPGGALFEISPSGAVTNLTRFYSNSAQITSLGPLWGNLFVGGWSIDSPLVSELNISTSSVLNFSLSGAWNARGGETFGLSSSGNEAIVAGGMSTQYGNYSGALLGKLYTNGTFVDMSASLFKNPSSVSYSFPNQQEFYVYTNETVTSPGSAITFYGQFLLPDSQYTISYANITDPVTTNSAGRFSFETNLSAAISSGDYLITLSNSSTNFYNYFAVPYTYSEMMYGAHYPNASKYVPYSNLKCGAVVRDGNYIEFYRVANGTFPITSINYLVQWNQILFQNLTAKGWTVAPVNQLNYASEFSINPLTFQYSSWNDFGISKVSQEGVFENYPTDNSSIFVNGSTMIVWIPYSFINEKSFPWMFATDYVQNSPVYNPAFRIEAGQNFVSYFYANETPSIFSGSGYTITFNETGLPQGMPWIVRIINNSANASSYYGNYSSSGSSLSLKLPKGDYKYVALTDSSYSEYADRYTTPQATGKLSVSGNLNVNLSFEISPTSICSRGLSPILAGNTSEFSVPATNGPTAISFDVMNSTINVRIVEGTDTILNKTIIGQPTQLDVMERTGSYGYVNYDANGSAVEVYATNSGPNSGLFAYNLWNYYISNYTASLETVPPQFSENLNPTGTFSPLYNNTGISFTFIAPYYSDPVALAFWIGEGYFNPVTGKEWWAQVGFNNWLGGMNDVSYAGWGVFSNIFGSPGGTDGAFPLIANETYTVSMQLISNDTWGFFANGRPILEPGLPGYINTTSSYANEGVTMGFEVLSEARAGSENATSLLPIKVTALTAMRVRVNGQWETVPNFAFNNVGENWGGNFPGEPGAMGLNLWSIQGNFQNKSIPPGEIVFGGSDSPLFNIPASQYNYPIYGNFTYPYENLAPNGTYVEYDRMPNNSLLITPLRGPVLLSLLQFKDNTDSLLNFTNYIITKSVAIENPYNGTSEAISAAPLNGSAPGYNDNFQEVVISDYNPSACYIVTFSEHNLPEGTSWSVTLNGTKESTVTGTISFTEGNGSYNYIVTAVSGFTILSNETGIVSVDGSNITVNVPFAGGYSVTFTESGLPAGLTWYINLSNGMKSGAITGSSYVFTLVNGTYTYTVTTSDKTYVPFYSGSIAVDGSMISESVLFLELRY